MARQVDLEIAPDRTLAEAEPEPVAIAVVGAGYWGPNLVRNAATNPAVKLVAVCDQDFSRASRLAASLAGVEATDDLQELLDDPSIEAIAVATPVVTHLEVVMAALEAGKHVLAEKPLASSYSEGLALVNTAAERGVVLMLDHTYCYTPAVQKIRQLLHSGELGELQFFDSVRINLGPVRHDVNALWDLAPHDLSILDYVLPDGCSPLAVAAHGADPIGQGQEGVVYLSLELPGNAIAHVNVNWLSPVKVRTTTIGGSKRNLVWDDLNVSQRISVYDRGVILSDPENLDADDRQQVNISYRLGDTFAPALPEREALQGVMTEFADCVRTGRASLTDGWAGLRVLDILEAASRSLEFHGAVVPLRLGR